VRSVRPREGRTRTDLTVVPEAASAKPTNTVAAGRTLVRHIGRKVPRLSAHTMGPRTGPTTDVSATDEVEASDVVLLARARSGELEAFAQLWRRHLPAAHAAATPFRGRVSAEDLVAEASARLFRLLSEGRGPSSNFRAYFVSTVRTVGVDAVRRETSVVPTSTTDLDLLPGPDDGLSALSAQGVDTDLVREAFLRLSEDDRRLLWQTMVEGQPPRVVARDLGVSANVASARARRARDELRDRYLDSWLCRRVPRCLVRDCRWTLDHLAGHVRGRLTERQRARVEAHLARCPREAGLAVELQRVYDGFGALTGPLVLAAGAATMAGLPQGAMAALVGSSTTGAATGAGSAGLGGTLTMSGAGATASGAATAGTGVTAGATAASTGTAVCAGGAGGAVLATPVATGVVGTTALVSSAAVVAPVAAVTGGSILAGTAIGPPLATAMAGLVVGLGLSVAPAAAADVGPATTSVVAQVEGATAASGTPPEVGVTPGDVLQLVLLPTPRDPAPVEAAPAGPASLDPALVGPAPSDPAPADPAPASSALADSAPTSSAPPDPAPSDPAPSDPAPSDPAPASPAPADPPPGDHGTADPAPSDPTASDPTASDPTASDPTASDPTASDPTASDPTPVDRTPAQGGPAEVESGSSTSDPPPAVGDAGPADPWSGPAPARGLGGTNAESSPAAEYGQLPPAAPRADPTVDPPAVTDAPAQAADGPAGQSPTRETPTGDARPAGA